MSVRVGEGSRVLVGRIPRGESLKKTLDTLAQTHGIETAWISALGAFEWVDLVEYDQDAQKYETPMRVARCELLSLVGNCSDRDGVPWWHVHATVSHVGEGRDKVYGGHVENARVFALEYRIECYDGLVLRREVDPETGLQLWPVDDGNGADTDAGAATDTDTARDTATATGADPWSVAAEASRRVQEELSADLQPVQGEWIDHSKFGLCRVDLVKGDMMVIKLPDARRKKLKASLIRFSGRRTDGDRTIYTVEIR